jgi:hypothetical protein
VNGFGKSRHCTDHAAAIIIDFYRYLATAIVTIRQLINGPGRSTDRTPDPPPAGSGDTHCRSLQLENRSVSPY